MTFMTLSKVWKKDTNNAPTGLGYGYPKMMKQNCTTRIISKHGKQGLKILWRFKDVCDSKEL